MTATAGPGSAASAAFGTAHYASRGCLDAVDMDAAADAVEVVPDALDYDMKWPCLVGEECAVAAAPRPHDYHLRPRNGHLLEMGI